MMKMKKKYLLIQLVHNGTVCGQIKSTELKDEIVIGRSESCTWKIPHEDRISSSVHARIYRKGNKLFIQDLKSRNGIYFMGDKIQERRLASGDLYSIGDCKLTVERCTDEPKHGSYEKYHMLEQLNGRDRGKIYELKEKINTIGSASTNTIVIPDSLISNVHAELKNHPDGTCWIRDKKSRNGTKINGGPVEYFKSEPEFGVANVDDNTGKDDDTRDWRMLKDGDVISIVFVDFRFWDKNVIHVRSHLLLKIGAVAATLAIALSLFIAFQMISPDAKTLRLRAEKHAKVLDFNGARELLVKATTARGADVDASQRRDLSRKINLWEETIKTRNQAQSILSDKPSRSALYDANALLSKITSLDRECWQWDISTADQEMQKARETHALLSSLLGAEERLQLEEENVSSIADADAKLKNAMEVCRKNPQAYQDVLQTKAADLVAEMERRISENQEIQTVMGACKTAAKIESTITALEKLQNRSAEANEQRKKDKKVYSRSTENLCKKLLAVLRDLKTSFDTLNANNLCLAQFEFAKFQEDLHLPSNDALISFPNLSACRLEMEQNNLRLKQLSLQLKNFQTFFTDNNLAPGMTSDLLTGLFDKETWNKTLACDCLELPQPSYSEKTSRSVYDRVLGVYVFWEYLRSLGGDFDTMVFEERFKPELFIAKDVFNNMEVFLAFCNPMEQSQNYAPIKRLTSENDGKNAFSSYVAQAKSILKERDSLIREMHEKYLDQKDERSGIIAGGIAVCLVPDSWKEFSADELAQDVNKSLRKLRAKLAELNEQSLDTTPEQRLENEKKILEVGIPGDSFLKQPWSDHVQGGK